MRMGGKRTMQAVVGVLVVASIGFIVFTWSDFYLRAGPGSGHRVIGDYIDDHRVRLGASVVLAAALVWSAAGYFAWKSRHVLGAIWDDLRQVLAGR